MVVEREPEIVFSVSHTTRPRREGERNGIDYHFVNVTEFRRIADGGGFVEYAEYNGNLYGTSWASIEEPLVRGRSVLLEIEIQGARQVRERLPQARLVFLLPPSLAELERRLRSRGTDAPESIERRLAIARQEIRAADWFDYLLVNDRLDATVGALCEIIAAERAGAAEEVRGRFGREAVLPRVESDLGL
jgi:guanylate kinase